MAKEHKEEGKPRIKEDRKQAKVKESRWVRVISKRTGGRWIKKGKHKKYWNTKWRLNATRNLKKSHCKQEK